MPSVQSRQMDPDVSPDSPRRHIVPRIIAQLPQTELLTRAITAILLNGPADENELVIEKAARYNEYSVILHDWKAHPLLSDFTVDLTTIQGRAE